MRKEVTNPGSLGLWTHGQRRSLSIVLLGLLIYLSIRYALNPSYVPLDQPDSASRAGEVVDRIDPNTADWPALAALPVIGPAVARRIVEERESYRAIHPDQTPYGRLEDLLRVKGIGQATLKNIEPYLIFQFKVRPPTQP